MQLEYLLSAANVLTNSLKLTSQSNKDFFQFNISQIHGKIRLIVVPCWFQQCLETVITLFTESCSESRSFRRLNQPAISEYIISEIISLRYSAFYSIFSKFHAHFTPAKKNLENVFCLKDNGVWICVKVCKLQREYLLSAVNDLTNSLKITIQTNKDFFQFNISEIHEKIR